MCSIILAYKYFSHSPFVIGMNRDEIYLRKSLPPTRWKPNYSNQTIISPKDISGGGTWFAVGKSIVSALTNIETETGSPKGSKSRGELPLLAVQHETRESVINWLNDFSFADFGNFNLIIGNDLFCFCVSYFENKLNTNELDPGIYILCNSEFNNKNDERLCFVENNLKLNRDSKTNEFIQIIKNNLSIHAEAGTCRHYQSFGTLSSFVFIKSAKNQLFWSEGAPCSNEYHDFSDLFIN